MSARVASRSHKTTDKAAPAAAPPAETSASPAPQPAPLTAAHAFPPPKPGAGAPATPQGYDATTGAVYRGVQPRVGEAAVLDDALLELIGFKDYAATFGKAAPPQAHLVQALQEGKDWAEELVAALKWVGFCTTQQGIAWSTVRGLMAAFKPQYDAAAKADSTVATEHPKLTKFVNAQKDIAQKGVATRQANKQAKAEGKPEIHGRVGKERQKRAAKKALEEQGNGGGNGGAAAAPAGGAGGAGTNGTGHA